MMWDELPKPNVISLKYRKDRHEEVKNESSKIGLNVNMHYVDKHPKGGEQGCFESHVQLCKMSLEAGHKQAFILEDDFEVTGDFLNQNSKCIDALLEAIEFMKNKKWKLFYLGVLPNWWTSNSKRVGKLIYQLQPWACTHSYLIHESYMKEVSEWKYTGTPIDKMYRNCDLAFAIQPQIFKQRNSPSDINHFITPCPDFLRDVPVNFSGWYSLNIGISGMNLFFMVLIFMGLTKVSKKELLLSGNN